MAKPEQQTAKRQKELGAFYTPRPMADLLVDWCIRDSAERMIDPSFGGYVFLESTKERLKALGASDGDAARRIWGVDIDREAVASAHYEGDGLALENLIESDFFAIEPGELPEFDANIGNPPYVRFQDWDGESSRAHSIAEAEGVTLTKLSSLWAPFLIHGCRFLKIGGRMGQVLPAELLHAQYAAPVLRYLESNFAKVTLALFDERVFPGALEEVVLLFAEGFREGPAAGIGVVRASNVEDLKLKEIDGRGDGFLVKRMPLLTLLPRSERELYIELEADERVKAFSEYASVGIGAVTGANKFFLRNRTALVNDGRSLKLFKPAIGRAAHLRGARLRQEDLDELDAAGRPTRMLVTNGSADPESLKTIETLIKAGEEDGISERYKCRTRDPWWSVPLPRGGTPDAFMTYMSDQFPRIGLNEASALSTNTIHFVSVKDRVNPAAFTVAFYNSLTLLSAELVGRSYGGGLLKLEPTEAGSLIIPQHPDSLGRLLPKVDRLLRAGKIETVLDLVDLRVLTPLGLTNAQIEALREARNRLVTKRRGRARINV